MTEELQELGLQVGHRRVGRLMRENGIKIIRTQKYKVTSDSNHAVNIASNLLDQGFSADGLNQKWAGDISYIWTSEGWLYLAVILDLYSRCAAFGLPGELSFSRVLRSEARLCVVITVSVLEPLRRPLESAQYCSGDYRKRLSTHGFQVSMSGKGNCYDNSMVETFFKPLKAKLIWRNRWETRRQAEGEIFKYINGFFNPRRRHSSLDGKSPHSADLRCKSSVGQGLAFERKAT